MNTRREWTFGPHRATELEPDVVLVKFNGPTTLEGAKQAVEAYREICSEQPRYAIIDISESSIAADGRKHLADNLDPAWFLGVVYVGAGLMMKTVTKALTVMVLFNAPSTYEIAFADSVEEGVEKVRGLRAQRTATAAG